MRKIIILTMLCCWSVLAVEAAPKQQAQTNTWKNRVLNRTAAPAQQDNNKPVKVKTLIITGLKDPKLTGPALSDEKLREAADQAKVVSDRNLKIIADLLSDKAEIWHLPKSYKNISIAGRATVTKAQAVGLLKRYNMELPLSVTAEELVDIYEEEATLEHIKWDVAFCQALVETGFFNFGGTVVPEQNNFCGLGTTSATVRGAYFLTPREGVRAHIQHLMAYSTARKPRTALVDPRYYLVYNNKIKEGFFSSWSELNGKWATGSDYAEKILNLHQQMEKLVAAMPAAE